VGCRVLRYVFCFVGLALLTKIPQAELAWWSNNRTIQVTSPYTGQTYSMAHYAVNNSAPRPESYIDDYMTVHDPTLSTPLTDSQAAELYGELASGAETGWDYSSRFQLVPQLGNPGLRTLNVKNNVPICLNSILCEYSGWPSSR
jgi:alpha,alpha-trehalase